VAIDSFENSQPVEQRGTTTSEKLALTLRLRTPVLEATPPALQLLPPLADSRVYSIKLSASRKS
jgi:hypothetical protein